MEEFEKLYTTHFQDVYRYIRRLSGNGDIAEEITAQTFVKALGSLGSFRGDCDLRVWLCQIAKNCYYTHLKNANRTDSLEALDVLPDPDLTPEERHIQQEQSQRIRRILHTIPETYKEVFMWRVFAELSFRQIGQLFGKSENWACVTYHRARAMVRTRLEEES